MGSLDKIALEIQKTKFEIGSLAKQKQAKEMQLADLKHNLLVAMRDEEKVETSDFIFSKKMPKPSNQTAYKVSTSVSKDEQEEQLNWVRVNHPELLKEELKVDPKPIRQQLAKGTLHIANNGKVVDDNGELIPGVYGELKPVEADFKPIKESRKVAAE